MKENRKNLTGILPNEIRARLERIAEREGCALKDIFFEAVLAYLDQKDIDVPPNDESAYTGVIDIKNANYLRAYCSGWSDGWDDCHDELKESIENLFHEFE